MMGNQRIDRRKALGWLAALACGVLLLGSAGSARAESGITVTASFASTGSSSEETSIGDLVADAVRQAGGAQVGLVHSGALQPDVTIPKGAAKPAQFMSALSFRADPVVVLTVTGEVLRAALERSVMNLPESNPGFLQVSGISCTINGSARTGSRVGTVAIGGKSLDRAAEYTVAMPQSLAQGSNGYFLVWPARTSQKAIPSTVGDALNNYLGGHDTLSPPTPPPARIIQ